MGRLTELTGLFADLGIEDPKGWATSQLDEEIPQLTRATILVEFANAVNSSVEQVLEKTDLPSKRLQKTLAGIKAAGISDDDLGLLLKFSSALTVFSICSVLDGATEISNNPGNIAVALAHGAGGDGEDDLSLEISDLGLHESWSEVATAILGKEVYW
jgi:hypothetical protein